MLTRIFVLLTAILTMASVVYAHGDATHLVGTIIAIEGDHIQIQDQAGKKTMVMLQKNTKYVKSEKPSTKAELKVGTRVLIDAKMDDKMKMYAAEEVAIGITETAKPANPKAATPQTKSTR
jgi:hypothetical protein